MRKPCSRPDHARPVERLLIVARLAERSADNLPELVGGRHRAEESGIEHRIEQPRPARQDRGESRRRPHDVGDEPREAWIGGEQREELHAGRHLGHDLVEGGEREVGVGGAAEGVEQRGKERAEPLARPLAARRGIAAGLPGPHRGDRRLAGWRSRASQARRARRDRPRRSAARGAQPPRAAAAALRTSAP